MKQEEALNTLNDIRDLMEKSTKFLSLSGLSSIVVGLYACAGTLMAYHLLGTESLNYPTEDQPFLDINTPDKLISISLLALGVLAASLLTVFLLSYRKCRREGKAPFLTPATKRLLWNFFLPLATGGIFCFSLLLHGYYGLTSSIMLLFYGLSLVNASKYTYSNTRYLGFAEIALGLIDSFVVNHALLFWVCGFGIFHIIYGIFFYLKIEQHPTRSRN